MAKAKIRITRADDEKIIQIDLNREISEQPIERFLRPIAADNCNLHELGPMGSKIITGLMAISGIIELFIHPYELTVIKAPLFDWADLEPQIVDLLVEVILDGEQDFELINSDPHADAFSPLLDELQSKLEPGDE